jgi:recombinational DNA repair protein (RecF pathway)
MKVELEKCVSCGRETGYSINDHIDSRKTYVEGAGQLCAECFK